MRLNCKARENESIKYVDLMSLYPYIRKYFPVGHSIIHVGDACKNIEACLRTAGLIKYSIVPPEKLYHPVHHSDVTINSSFACVERASSLPPPPPQERRMRIVLSPIRG